MNKENINNIIGNQASHILRLIDEGKIPEARACTENLKELWELYGFAIGYSEKDRCFRLERTRAIPCERESWIQELKKQATESNYK